MRLAAAIALLCLAPAAQGALTVGLAAPAGPIPLDGSQSLTVTLGLDCADLLLRGGDADIALAFGSAMPFVLDGPATVTAAIGGCKAGTSPAWTGTATYTVSGSRFIPGLVPHAVNFTATIPAGPALAPAETRSASAALIPEAVVNYTFEPVRALPTDNRGEPVPITLALRSHGNVALAVRLQGSGSASHDATEGFGGQRPLPQGTLTLPANLTLPAAGLDGQPGSAQGTGHYQAPAGRAGTDRFAISAVAQPTLDASATPLERLAELEVRFDLRPVASPDGAAPGTDGSTDGPAGRVGHHVDPVETPAAGPIVLALTLALGAAARRRRPA